MTISTSTTTTTTAPPPARIESRSIDYIPASERHGKVWQQGPFWFLGNFQPFTVAIGLLGPVFGLSFWWTVLASAVGILFGTFFMAFHASQGPHLGLPQMIQSRAQMGYRGVLLPLVTTVFTFVGFNVVDTVIIDTGLHGLYGWNRTLIGIAITLLAAVLAIYGHDWLHIAFRVLFVVSIPFWVVLTIGILAGAAGGHGPSAPLGFTAVGFFAQATVAASYNVTYAPYVSDYSRYLPRDTATSRTVLSVFWGAAGSPLWLIPIGAWLATYLGASDPIAGIHDAASNVFGPLGDILVVLSVLALVATMGLNAYSAMLTVITGVDSVRPVPRTATARIVCIVLVSVVAAVLGVFVIKNPSTALNNSLLIMLYLLAPWTAVNLVDYFFVRRGNYAITDLFRPDGIYGSWAWRGLVAYLVGIVVEIPFMYLTDSYQGFLAHQLDDVDISFLVGLVVAGGVYYAATRSLDLPGEQPAVDASEAALPR